MYAQPLVVGSAVIVATEGDTVYALDVSTGSQRWVRHLAAPVPGSSLPCGNIDPSGITGTPVADPARGLLWVVSFSLPSGHTLWSVALASGAVISSRNVDPPGADRRAEQQRGALLMDGSTVYVPYGGLYGDCSDYHGWVVGMSTSAVTSATQLTYETPTARSAIWAPPGPVLGTDGSLFLATGNGIPVDVAGDSNSVVRLSPSLAVEGSFTPANYASLSAADQGLGSTSPAILPGGLVFQVGKQGVGYLLRGTALGGLAGQRASSQICGGGFGGTAVDGESVFVACYDGLFAVSVSAGADGSRPRLAPVWSARGVRPGPPMVAGGAVWAVDKGGALVGFAETTGTEIYRQSIGVAGSFASPAAANGRLFAPDSDRITAFQGI